MLITDVRVCVDNDIACGMRIGNIVNQAAQFEARLASLYPVRRGAVPAGIGAPVSMGFL